MIYSFGMKFATNELIKRQSETMEQKENLNTYEVRKFLFSCGMRYYFCHDGHLEAFLFDASKIKDRSNLASWFVARNSVTWSH